MAPFSLLLFLLFSLFTTILSQPQYPKGFLINCGAVIPSQINGRQWLPDSPYISSGTPRIIPLPGILPALSTLRSFPLSASRKFCYTIPVYRTGKYLVRTTYFYGGFDGRDLPPVFDQIVDGTVWSVVNTTEDYRNGLSTYYEGVFLAKGRTMSICVGRNTYTDSEMFISTLELLLVGNSLYNSTDFSMYGLTTVARHNFGYGGPVLRFPDDQFDRFWRPFTDSNTAITSPGNASASGIWNLPPSKVFDTALTTDQVKPMELQWPPVSLPNSNYSIALYFADNRGNLSADSTVFNVSINGIEFYHNLKPTPSGVAVFVTQWPLSGLTKLVLTPAAGSNLGPLISAGEVFGILVLGGRTVTRDIIALEGLRKNLQNSPLVWNGDPCLPREYSWTGITCSEGSLVRVVALNLSNMGLSGSLSQGISNLTALTDILLGNNNLSGPIPDLSPLRRLERLHLQDNQLSGEIPPSLGNIVRLRELFLQNNNLTGEVPSSLKGKSGLNLQTSGNQFSLSSATPPS
ncbi:probable LRR receptor-like serine/threonine-protein kinase At5g59680 [Magnolia sinica]|uniref:probable LRR receptor-like serine/threonine-protein kinase At5g59680 n=1 Tax=Magnolia sinica TaxID=86752 RepID=UPI0026588B3E|nr:probable LRR receptor-like serine/threonine-protein kinase At5g59680 [Magnolia sinica]